MAKQKEVPAESVDTAAAEQAATNHGGEIILSKLTIKGCGADPKDVLSLKDKEAKWGLVRILGVASGLKVVKDTRGDVHEAITGNFEATNLETGEVFRSGVLYLPGGVHDMVLGAVKTLGEGDTEVQFAFDIYSVRTTSAAGYGYESVNLMPASKHDPMAELRKALPAPQPQAA